MLIESPARGSAKCLHSYARSPAKSSGSWNRRRLMISPASAGKGALGDFVEKLAGKTDEPSPSEQAAFAALTLFGLHMQSATKPMHTAEISFARACGKLYATGTSESIKSRVDAMLLARDEKSRLLQIRSLVSLLRSKELPCDYGKLASDLRALMNPKRRPGVQLRWGRDFANGSFQTESTSETKTSDNLER